jgi:hypothetical protein
MLSFPPARLPSDPALGIEPIRSAPLPSASPTHTKLERADRRLFAAGCAALAGELLATDDGRFIQVLAPRPEDGAGVAWFEWNGSSRRLRRADDDPGRALLLEALRCAWPYRGDGELRERARRMVERAQAYDEAGDPALVAENFELLLANTDRVLSEPAMANGAPGSLHASFAYFGTRRFPVSALLGAWREGLWRVPCPRGKGRRHEAYLISGSGGLSTGTGLAYCPSCGRLEPVEAPMAPHFASIARFAPRGGDGLRLDEIVEELTAARAARSDGA